MEASKAKAAVQIANVYIKRFPDNPVLLAARDTAMESEVLALVQAGKAREAMDTLYGHVEYLPDNKKLNALKKNTVVPVSAVFVAYKLFS